MANNTDSGINFVEINRRLWNDKVDYHLVSPMYNVPGFLAGDDSLNKIEKDLLGDIRANAFFIYNVILDLILYHLLDVVHNMLLELIYLIELLIKLEN